MSVVAFEEVTFGYGDRAAVEDVSLTVESGEFLGFVAPNDSGTDDPARARARQWWTLRRWLPVATGARSWFVSRRCRN